jgi:hypothetical protein
MAKRAVPATATDEEIRILLEHYRCPVPFHEVRARFLGNIATPAVGVSPIKMVERLWSGELPEFNSIDAANALIGALIMGLWNRLTRHQERSAPFRLVRPAVMATREGLATLAIEQGGTSLYPTLALKVTNPVVLRILLSIDPTETMHFQTWQDKAGNAPPLTDPTNGLTFPDLNASRPNKELFQTNLIMPEPCPFLSRKFPPCSIIRPVSTSPAIFGAVAAITGLKKSGLFNGQSPGFFAAAVDLATKADAATRMC